MLNFHDHIEFKPLLIHTDQRLAREMDDQEKSQKARRSLQSVTRRVRDRQLAMLVKECRKNIAQRKQTSDNNTNKCLPQSKKFYESDSAYLNEAVWKITAPDRVSSFDLRVLDMDWENLKFKIELKHFNSKGSESELISFNITPFDLPFTDNMFVGESYRFALGVAYVAPERFLPINAKKSLEKINERYIDIKAMWFPKNYILPNERPVNYKEIRDLLNIE